MGRTFTQKITTDALAGAIAYALAISDFFEGSVKPSACSDAIDFLRKNHFRSGKITFKILNDLKKVQFDEENVEWEDGEGYHGTESITGFHTLSNGLTFLGISAGGDWESPLFYIIYYDGTRLRGYIPEDGNHWNTSTNTAYGSEGEDGVGDEEKAMEDNLKKRFGVSKMEELPEMNPTIILADIEKRILLVPGDFVKPKGLADIDETRFIG